MTTHGLTAERLRELLKYDPETGVFTWRVNRSRSAKAGDVAGCLGSKGYAEIRVDGHSYKSHRLVWLYVHGAWPANEIDHINRVRADNRLSNLRAATPSENKQNTGLRSDNTSGFRGVCWDRKRATWIAHVTSNGKQLRLGRFDTPEEAHAAYCAAAAKLHTCNPIAS